MKENNKFIFSAEDLGGYNAIAAVAAKLNCEVFKNHLSDDEIENAIKNAFIVVVGTSASYESLDKRFVRAAKKIGIKSVAVLDSWVNYEVRFKDAVPDYIFVMDDIAKIDLMEAGFDPEKISVTGNPYFDKFKKIEDEGNSIVFFCQPFTELENNIGLNEIEILNDFVDAFKNLGIEKKIKVKMHPRTKNLNKFENLDIEITTSDTTDLIREAKLVIGMNSMALFEATMSGRKVLSYQPGLNVKDPLVTNRLGLTKAVYKKTDLEKSIIDLMDEKHVINDYKLVKNARDNVIDSLNALVKNSIQLRPATIEDADVLLKWRNDPEVRKFCHTTEIIEIENHISWLNKVLNDKDRKLFIVMCMGRHVG